MEENREKIDRLSLIGGALCLDFTNLVNWRDSPNPKDYMGDYEDLVQWSAHAGILTPPPDAELVLLPSRQPAVAERVFMEARELREIIFRIFSAPAEGTDPPADDLGALNAFLSRSMAAAAFEKEEDGFVLSFGGGQGPDRMLPPIVWSAVQLLTSPDMRRVKVCSGDTCGWLFIDSSKNRSRRWCEMSDCGNRAKARRHYQKVKEKTEREPQE